MILLQLDPLSKPVAISEMLLLLAGAAFIGWLLARWIVSGRINGLRESIAGQKAALEDCEATHKSVVSNVTSAPSVNQFVATEAISSVPDNLKLVEGIGPKIEGLLNADGIYTFAKLATSDPGHLSNILREAGPRFQMHDPGTWPEQAALARDGHWDQLKVLQERLNGGKK